MQRSLSALPALLLAALLLGGCGTAQPFRGMGAQDIYQTGMRSFEAEEWDDAIEAFERVLFSFPNFANAPEARFNLARAFFEKGEYVTAASEFTRFLDRFPTHELAPDAALRVCRSYVRLSPIVQRDQSFTRQALASCDNVARDYAATEQGERAREHRAEMRRKLARKVLVGGQFYLERKLYDSAIIYFSDVVQNYSETDAVPAAMKGLVEANTAIGYQEEAEDWRQRLLSEYPDSEAARQLREGRANGG